MLCVWELKKIRQQFFKILPCIVGHISKQIIMSVFVEQYHFKPNFQTQKVEFGIIALKIYFIDIKKILP